MKDYLLGLATLPALAVFLYVLGRVIFALIDWLDKRGWTMDLKAKRKVSQISEYILRNNIWFERARGPVFSGHWCRDEFNGHAEATVVVTRWWGIGSVHGPCAVVYYKRKLS